MLDFRAVLVFLSSTFLDLIAERAAVYEHLSRHHEVVRMEDFGSGDEPPLETCLRAVERSDVYVLLLGHRYGAIAPGHNLSYTHAEYERARECGIPVLPYIKDGIDDAIPRSDHPGLLRDFRNALETAHTINRPYFRSPDELAQRVLTDIDTLPTDSPRPRFARKLGSITRPFNYAAHTTRYTWLQLRPILVVLVDLSVIREWRYPSGRAGRLREKISWLHERIRAEGARVLIFNEIPASHVATALEERATHACERADMIICISRGQSDIGSMDVLTDCLGAVALWYPHHVPEVPTGIARSEPYTDAHLQDCDLALWIYDYVDHTISRMLFERLPA